MRFFGSTDLREWKHLSDFGPAGAISGIWECPDLFTLPVDGDANSVKWVLKVDDGGAGAGGSQYFIGQFDGEHFICDDPPERIRQTDRALDTYRKVATWDGAPEKPEGQGRFQALESWKTSILARFR